MSTCLDSFIDSFTHLLILSSGKYLLSLYYVPSTYLVAENPVRSQGNSVLAFLKLIPSKESKTNYIINNYLIIILLCSLKEKFKVL